MQADEIEARIYSVREQRVMFDVHLARLYGVSTKRLNEQVGRNANRFPADFMFVLTKEEAESLRVQIETQKKGRGGRRYLPLAFTEQGVAMLSSVLNSERAVQVDIEIMRTFVRIKKIAIGNREIMTRLDALEKKYNRRFRIVFEAIRHLMEPPVDPMKLS